LVRAQDALPESASDPEVLAWSAAEDRVLITNDRNTIAMIPATQREALAVLAEVCELSPDVRLGQLLAHLGFLGEDDTGRSLWDIDDEQLLAVLYRHRAELADRKADAPNYAQQPTEAANSVSQASTPQHAAPAAEPER